MLHRKSRSFSNKNQRFIIQIALAAIAFAGFAVSNCFAAPTNIVYAGFAFRGNASEVKKSYPHALEISEVVNADGRKILEKALADRVFGLSFNDINLIPTGGDNDSLVMACSLDDETVNIEEYDDGYKIVIDLGAQILLFDIKEKKLIASYPFTVQLIDFSIENPTDSVVHEKIFNLLLSKKYDVNLLDDFVDLLQKVELKKTYGSTIKVTEVVVGDKVLPFLSPRFKNNINAFKVLAAQGLGKFMSKNQAVSILPYSVGSDIGGKMTLRFLNAETVSLSIPEPHFGIKLTIRGFKKVETAKKAAGSNWVYGTYTKIAIEQPLLGEVYMDEKIKNGVNKKIPSVQKSVNDWPVFQESMMDLFNKLTKSFSEDRKYKKLNSEVIAKCR